MMHVMQSAPGPETIIDGRKYLYFCGTGYLGLHGHPDIVRAACEAIQQLGMGTATNRAGFGNAQPTIDVERRAAQFWDTESAFYFASGYLGNHVLLSALATPADMVFLDEYSHFSVVDACRFFDLAFHRFRHRDAQSLREALQTHLRPNQAPIVMCDGVFASLGSIAPVTEYIDVLEDYPGAMLCLDDCHAYGVLGERGRGTYEHFACLGRVTNDLPACDRSSRAPQLYSTGTLSKSFGCYGGIVAGRSAFVASTMTSSHYYRAASAPPLPVAAASAAALKLVMDNPDRVHNVQQNAIALKQRLTQLGLDVNDTPVPIISLVLNDKQNMQRIQQALADEGILIAYSENYSGLGEAGALRIAVFATHSEDMLDALCASLGRHL